MRRVGKALVSLCIAGACLAGCGGEDADSANPAPTVSKADVPPVSSPDALGIPAEDLQALFAQLRSRRTRDDAYARLATDATRVDLPALHAELASSPSDSARWRLARVIGRLEDRSSVGPLRRSLRDDDSYYVRRNAAYALGWIRDRAAVDDLRAAMQSDSDTSVRKRSAWALEQILGGDADTLLREAADREPDGGVRLSLEWLMDETYRTEATAPPVMSPGEIVAGAVKGTYYLFYLPTTYDPDGDTPVLVSVHGTDGRPEDYAQMCVADAEKYGVAVVAPYFDYITFPNYDLLETDLGSVRADLRLFEILDQVANAAPVSVEDFYLFGHSKGGQFVSRMVLAHFDRIIAAAAGGPGHYITSDPNTSFPNGTKTPPFAPDLDPLKFAVLVRSRLAIVLGENELERRIEAANNFMGDVQTYAEQNNIPSRVEFFWVRGGGHFGRSNWPTASAFLFRDLAR